MLKNYSSLQSALSEHEAGYLEKLGFDRGIIEKYSDNLTLSDFLSVRDLAEAYNCSVNALEKVLALWDGVYGGSSAVVLTDCEKENLIKLGAAEYGEESNNPLGIYEDYLCFDKHFKASIDIAKAIKDLQKESDFCDLDDNKVCELVPKFNQLHKNQQEAVKSALKHRLHIITGGPGTGKTTVISAILCLYKTLGGCLSEIALAAPTGRAADRMKESIESQLTEYGIEEMPPQPSTIHRLTDYRAGKASRTLSQKLIIVDEFSMADLSLAAALFGAAKDAIIILVGDPDQLPSVEAGCVLSQLVEKFQNRSDYLTKLTENFRSQENIKILKDNLSLENCRKTDSDSFKNNILNYIKESAEKDKGLTQWIDLDNENISALIDNWFELAYLEKHYDGKNYCELIKALNGEIDFNNLSASEGLLTNLFSAVNKFKLLCCIREGILGCNNMNDIMEAALSRKLGKDNGVPVMITRNNSLIGLFNGDIGVMIKDKNGLIMAVFEKNKEFFAYPLLALENRENAFAITIHKSQGSEYEHEIILLPAVQNSKKLEELLCREILYTAVTRAKKSLVIAGGKHTFEHAAENKISRVGIPF